MSRELAIFCAYLVVVIAAILLLPRRPRLGQAILGLVGISSAVWVYMTR